MSRPKFIKNLKQKNPKLIQSEIVTIIDSFFDTIKEALKNSRKVELRGFGTFFVKKIKEKYSARNPKTGELIYVPEKNKVRFKASKNLKKLMNE
ncbi:integration host factor subunit beta [Pelagibacteraceae bacterium]|nr:integration host factor subunit beta [Pelagibacteraceae bacterium]